MSKGLKKKAAPKKVVTAASSPYCVQWGTPNVMTDTHRYSTIGNAKKAIFKEIAALVAWCERHNTEGLPELERLRGEIDMATFVSERRRVECLFDETYGMRWAVEWWKE